MYINSSKQALTVWQRIFEIVGVKAAGLLRLRAQVIEFARPNGEVVVSDGYNVALANRCGANQFSVEVGSVGRAQIF